MDIDNMAFLKTVIAEYGWPGHDLVGEDVATSAWLFAQHADRDPEFQRERLPLPEAAAQAGQARLQDWACLVNRVRVADGRPQLYGSQYTGDEGEGCRRADTSAPVGTSIGRAVGQGPHRVAGQHDGIAGGVKES